MAAFQLYGGHPALDLVNTLDNRFVEAGHLELLPGYSDVLRFARQSQILSARQAARLASRAQSSAASRVLRSVHELREALAALFYDAAAPADRNAGALHVIQRYALAADAQRQLTPGPASRRANSVGASWSWSSQENRLDLPLWILSKSAEALLTTADFTRVRRCQRDSCRWLFLDSSKNRSRRWCDMKVCGNRVKAQRFHAKHGH
jgi:predicted RNA-binding Zn ribbon-like protein